MRITRRNTLVVLLVIVAAGGIVGTGAFTSVSADRTVSVSTASDSNANVQFTVNNVQGLSNGNSGGDTIGLNFKNLNKDANTTFADALTITPQGGNGPYDVSISGAPQHVAFTVNDGTNVNGGTNVTADVSIDLRGGASTSDITDGNVTISVSQASS